MFVLSIFLFFLLLSINAAFLGILQCLRISLPPPLYRFLSRYLRNLRKFRNLPVIVFVFKREVLVRFHHCQMLQTGHARLMVVFCPYDGLLFFNLFHFQHFFFVPCPLRIFTLHRHLHLHIYLILNLICSLLPFHLQLNLHLLLLNLEFKSYPLFNALPQPLIRMGNL